MKVSDREDKENVTPKSAKKSKAKEGLWSEASKVPDTEDRPKGPRRSKTKEYVSPVASEVPETEDQVCRKGPKRSKTKEYPSPEAEPKRTKKKEKATPVEMEGEDEEVVEKSKKKRKDVSAAEDDSLTVAKKPKPPRDAVGLEENCDDDPEVGETPDEEPPQETKRKKMVGTVSRDASTLRLRTKTSMDSLAEIATPPGKRVDAPSPSISTPSTTSGGFLDPNKQCWFKPQRFFSEWTMIFFHPGKPCLAN